MKKHVIKTFDSRFNGTITVAQKDGAYSVEVDSVVESGQDLEKVWSEVFEAFFSDRTVNSVLVLGYGAGSVVKPIRRLWPLAAVAGVEIDPVMIKITQKFMPENLKNVEIVIGNAVDYVRKLNNTMTFDLVVLDCYIGGKELSQMKNLKFLYKLKKISKHVVVNQLFMGTNKNDLSKLSYLRELDTQYSVRILKLPFNIIIEY